MKKQDPYSSENLVRLPGVRAITNGWAKLSDAKKLRLVQLLAARCEMTGLRLLRGEK